MTRPVFLVLGLFITVALLCAAVAGAISAISFLITGGTLLWWVP
jgi:hypothetical protein